MVGIQTENKNQLEYNEVLEYCVDNGFLDVILDLNSNTNIDLILR